MTSTAALEAGSGPGREPTAVGRPLLQVSGLAKHFPAGRAALRRGGRGQVRAVDGLSFSVEPGQTLGIVGESGCGKSTTGRLIVRLLEPSAGSVVFDGEDITHRRGRDLRRLRRDLQMIFQDPYASLNPRQTIGTIVATPMRVQRLEARSGHNERHRR